MSGMKFYTTRYEAITLDTLFLYFLASDCSVAKSICEKAHGVSCGIKKRNFMGILLTNFNTWPVWVAENNIQNTAKSPLITFRAKTFVGKW